MEMTTLSKELRNQVHLYDGPSEIKICTFIMPGQHPKSVLMVT